MIPYDSSKTLISIHIPKCGGQSLTQVLKHWYGDNFFKHYQPTGGPPPKKLPLRPEVCIHGHFQSTAGLGVKDYYPEAEQFITFLRDPLDIHISNYFFWKNKARPKQIKHGLLKEGDPHDYRDIHDFFRMRPKSHIYKYMPCPVSKDNCRRIFKKKYVCIGFVEDMQKSIDRLADRLGFDPIQVNHINSSPRDEELPGEVRRNFIKNNSLAFHIYHTARELFDPSG